MERTIPCLELGPGLSNTSSLGLDCQFEVALLQNVVASEGNCFKMKNDKLFQFLILEQFTVCIEPKF